MDNSNSSAQPTTMEAEAVNPKQDKRSERTFFQYLKQNWISVLIIIYILSPIDFIPDAIMPIGTVDDVSLLIIEFLRQYIEYSKSDPQ